MNAGSTEAPQQAWRRGPTGVVDRGAFALGLHRNLRGPRASTRRIPGGIRVTNVQARLRRAARSRERTTVHNGWNRAWRQRQVSGAQGVRGSHSTAEAG